MSKTPLPELAAMPSNPRLDFNDEQRAAFAASLRRFGDLGGVVKNLTTGHLVGGHKRVEDFRADTEAPVVVTQRLKKPDACGTVAFGHIDCHGTRFSYREVKWSKSEEAAANIAANEHGAEFDWEKVSGLLKELPEDLVTLTGFSDKEAQDLLNEPVVPVVGHTRSPLQSDDDYSKFELVMKHTSKLKLVETLDAIRTKKGLDSMEEAILVLCKLWK